jgi:hypothetical protein
VFFLAYGHDLLWIYASHPVLCLPRPGVDVAVDVAVDVTVDVAVDVAVDIAADIAVSAQ